MKRSLNQSLGLCLLLMAFVAVQSGTAEPRRPNILYVIVDDQSPFDFSFYNQASTLHAPVIERLTAHLHDWALTAKYRVTRSDSDVAAYAENNNQLRTGIILGFWDEAELLAARKKAGLVEDDEQ